MNAFRMLFNTILVHRAKKWKYPSQGPDGYEYAGAFCGHACTCETQRWSFMNLFREVRKNMSDIF